MIVLDRRTGYSITRYTNILCQILEKEELIKFGNSNRFVSLISKYVTLPLRLFFSTSQIIIFPSEGYSYLIPLLWNKQKVIFIHDLHDIMDKNSSILFRCFLKWQLNFLSQADIVFSISNHTKNDVAKLLGTKVSNKIKVIYNPLEEHWYSSSLKIPFCKYVVQDKNYILLLGTNAWYKNLDRAFSVLVKFPQLEIVRVGSMKKEWVDLVGKDRVIQYIGLTDDELKYLYSHALCLFFPSIHEGFGWPVAEAMAVGCPVICSNRASLPEVAGDAVLYIDPYNILDMERAIRSLIENPDKRKYLIERGRIQARKFKIDKFEKRISSLVDSCYLNAR